MITEIKQEFHDLCEEKYYIFSKSGWVCQLDDGDIPMVFVIEFLHSSLFGEEEDFWSSTCGIMPKSDDMLEDLLDRGFLTVNINSINPQEELPFKKEDRGWTIGNDEEMEKAVEIAKSRSEAVMGLIGFFLDVPQNRIGQSGWDILSEWMGKSTFKDWIKNKKSEIEQQEQASKLVGK